VTTRGLARLSLNVSGRKSGIMVDMKFWASREVEIGDRFKRRSVSHKVYILERFIEHTHHPRHACLVCIENRETLTVALSVLFDGKLFERVEA
jgi:hypothetical protein